MTAIPESHRDILDTAPVGIVATVGPDGRPQVTASWFLAEDDGTVGCRSTRLGKRSRT